ncbi:hypothetical protein H6768_00970 [Candidatus Peribacteria bacterium]|nr:hypothetical protein [Candidatus Peribacteria bacterium]
MMAFLRKAFRFIFWWIVVILCIAFIGYIAWPLLSDKFYSLCANQKWELCRGDWGSVARADEVQQTIEQKTQSFYSIAKTAISDVLTDRGGKTPVKYELNSDINVYMPVPQEEQGS